MCGEQIRGHIRSHRSIGSSPRVRGTGTGNEFFTALPRFIPACAGNSDRLGQRFSLVPVHPRVCGEQICWRHLRRPTFGSSPRVRGTEQAENYVGKKLRFIPACAGNRRGRRRWSPTRPVHPRVCGEQSLPVARQYPCSGSSPRVRGTEEPYRHRQVKTRFIPACAGNRMTAGCEAGSTTVHPRVCGEQIVYFSLPTSWAGSSPRVRGTVCLATSFGVIDRFIPACAGNRSGYSGLGWARSVHPRVCGEQHRCWMQVQDDVGSSPRVRGTALLEAQDLGEGRFIPACAGNRSQAA